MYQFRQVEAVSGGGAVALKFHAPAARPASRSFGARAGDPAPARDFILVTDLGAGIGSAEWLRGLLTCLALCYAALSLAPGLEPIVGASPPPLSEAQLDEAGALSFGPLAYGADTGRRMAPTAAVQTLNDIPERPTLDLTLSLGRGDRFARVLERAGVGAAEAMRVDAMIAPEADMAQVRPGTPLTLTLGRRPGPGTARPLQALAFRARFDLKLSIERIDGRLALTRTPIAVDKSPLRIEGLVGPGLYRSARASGAPAKAVETYLRAIASQIDVGTLAPGDRFDIIIEHRRAATGETEAGKLLYAGLERPGGRRLQMMQWELDGRAQWFEASGVGRQSGALQRPVPGSVSSSFGMRRHPILGYARFHRGVDFHAGYGTPILATTDGRVAGAGWAGGYGKQVRIDHPGGITTTYSHMSSIAAQPGQAVRQGQVIGYVGSTGLSTGPHLHYELYRGGVPVNPFSVRFVQRSQLSGPDLEGFRAKLRGLIGLAAGARSGS
ncbi:MAG TPA: peptidoglycan DD-metalloendopeptidase family protein [Allosphingosinicella sp.]|jgi:murein DD-endopeptidase MepM/ murein hydrolase activator NlpD